MSHPPSLRPRPSSSSASGCRRALAATLRSSLVAVTLGVAARGQCVPQWLPGDGFDFRGGASTDVVNATLQMPNGDILIGGAFASVTGVAASNIARWDGLAWSPLGTGIQGGEVRALAARPNGDVIAGGDFTLAGGVPVNCIARWDGASWSALGSGVTGSSGMTTGISALAVLPAGSLVAGGHFTTAGGVAAANVAQWSGSTWGAMGSGLFNPFVIPFGAPPVSVEALAVRPNGTVVAGTRSSSTLYPPGVKSWNGTTWSSLAAVTPYCVGVGAIANLPNGDLVAAAEDTFFGWRVTLWSGGAWASIGAVASSISPSANVRAITVLGNGDIVCGGAFNSSGGVDAPNLARWNGTQWFAFGDVGGQVRALRTLANGVMLAGGLFDATSEVDCSRLGRWGCDANVAQSASFGRGCYSLASSFYERFVTLGAFDLETSTLQFTPHASGYDVALVPGAPSWSTPPAGSDLLLGDDAVSAPLPLPFTLPYPGGSTSQVVICSNGYVFLQPSTSTAAFPTAAGLLGDQPRHCAMWSDFDPAAGAGTGSVHFHVVGQTAYATWSNVGQYGNPSLVSSFQIALSANGSVEYRYQTCSHQWQALTGWSPGNGAQDPTDRDVSADGPFRTTSTIFRLPLHHAVDHRPFLGSTVTLTTSQLDATSVLGINLIGFTKYDPGVDLTSLGMPGCYLYTSLDLLFPFFPAAQTGSHTIAIPNQASLMGTQLFAQGVAWDLPVNPFGMVSSNGVSLNIGAL